MSNKLRNILLHAAIMLTFLMLCPNLSAFDPGENDFKTKYQFELYKSWLAKGDLKTHFSAAFTQDKVVKTFFDHDNRSIIVEYGWNDHLITTQHEIVDHLFVAADVKNICVNIKYIEGFIYRLNTRNQQFLTDYLNLDEISINYYSQTEKTALDMFWNDVNPKRIRFESIEIVQNDSSLTFALKPLKSEVLKLEFQLDFDFQNELTRISELELLISNKSDFENYASPDDKLYQPQTAEMIKKLIPQDTNITTDEVIEVSGLDKTEELAVANISSKHVETEKPDLPDYANLPKINELTLVEFIQYYIGQKQSRELLNNKISDPVEFLRKEFKEWEYSSNEDIHFLKHPPLKDEFHCELKLKIIRENDGLNILPADDEYKFEGKYLILSGQEKIDLRSLNDQEINQIAPSILQLVYEHRSLGSKLLNFLLIHDNVPTTLVIQTDERKLYELASYADLLLLLNNFWQERIIYFSIREVKKVNGYVEFEAYLIAHDKEKQLSDIAEIQFHLDNDFRIDLIMMVLHPNTSF
jgi:hypothetical protein